MLVANISDGRNPFPLWQRIDDRRVTGPKMGTPNAKIQRILLVSLLVFRLLGTANLFSLFVAAVSRCLVVDAGCLGIVSPSH